MGSTGSKLLLTAALAAGLSHCGPKDTAQRDAVSGVDAVGCPEGLVLWPDHGVCAPHVDECEAWEMPLVGGGCLAIGPRACPKAWDSEASANCEPGELIEYDGSACPEGFVLTEDEVACIPFFEENCGDMEVPLLGGGCQKVGPDWASPDGPEPPGLEIDEPVFDDCPEGLLALEGGGCIQVGPRACPKLWDPDADVDCEVGDILPCPGGWQESEDGMYCDPGYDECPFGERPVLGGGCQRVVPLEQDCPEGPFPDAPEGAAAVVYVSATSACVQDCGSMASPYPDISSALAAVPEGAHVLVGPGVYNEGLAIDKPVHVVGVCPAKTVVAGVAELPEPQESPLSHAGIAVVGTEDVHIASLGVVSPAVGIAVVGAKQVLVEKVEINGAAGMGVYVGYEAKAELTDVWIHDTGPGELTWMYGFGVLVQHDSRASVSKTLIESVVMAGVSARHAGTQVEIAQTTVRSTQSNQGGTGGYGLGAKQNAVVSMTNTVLEKNHEFGLRLMSGADASVDNSVIRDTKAAQNGGYGWGMIVGDGAEATLSCCLFDGNTQSGAAAVHSGAQVELSGTVVRDTKPDGNGEFGVGMQVSEGGTATVSACLFEGNRTGGVAVYSAGTQADLAGTVVRDTKPDLGGRFGTGAQVEEGATATVSSCLFEGNRNTGLAIAHSGTEVAISGTVMRDTKPDGNGEFGTGIQVVGGASATVSDSLLEGNTLLSVEVGGSGTHVDLSGTVVRGVKPHEKEEFGRGMQVEEGATATVSGCLFERNTEGGVAVFGSGTQVELSGTIVRDTQSNTNGEFGAGMQAVEGAAVMVSGSLLEGNVLIGVNVSGPGTQVALSDTVVRDTKPNEYGELGAGMMVGKGAAATVSGGLFEGNTEFGVLVFGSGAQVELSSTVVADTRPDGSGEFGRGMQVVDGATATVSSCLFEGNTEMGVAVYHPGTQVELSHTVVRDTKVNENGVVGLGMQVSDGAATVVSGCLFDDNRSEGVALFHSGTQVEMSGTVVKGTKPDENTEFGVGMSATGGAAATVVRCLFEGNTDIGVAVDDSGTQVDISGTVVRDTKPNEKGQFGRGMNVSDGATATLSGCLFEGNTQVGILGGLSGTQVELSGTVLRDTKPISGGYLGTGLAVSHGAEAGASMCLFQRNTTNGVAAFGEGTSLGLDTCAILDTDKGGMDVETGHGLEFQVFGDGILVAEGGTAEVTSTVVMGNERAGVFYHESSGEVRDSVIGMNSSYGLAMQSCEKDVKHEENGNFIFGNAFELPEEMKAQVTTEPMGMPVPEPPGVSEVSFGPLE